MSQSYTNKEYRQDAHQMGTEVPDYSRRYKAARHFSQCADLAQQAGDQEDAENYATDCIFAGRIAAHVGAEPGNYGSCLSYNARTIELALETGKKYPAAAKAANEEFKDHLELLALTKPEGQ